ncbi:kinase-like domain-containing protein [Kalaharituber pfeilii]|nr:kinase-like domain-containing protein [Kalaharituber pfeilii]
MRRVPFGSIPVTNLLSDVKVLSQYHLTTLWAGYGSIYRLVIKKHDDSEPLSIVLKIISPPSSDEEDEGHVRKVISYHVEQWFYIHLASRLEGKSKVARVYNEFVLEPKNDDSSAMVPTVLAIEDLNAAGFQYPCGGSISGMKHATAVLKWLAGMHATFWGENVASVPPPTCAAGTEHGVWQHGGYWYLATRGAEMQDLISSGEHPSLGRWGSWVDKKLWPAAGTTGDPTWATSWIGRTIVHGDTKGANILFSHAPGKPGPAGELVTAAIYDFQYVGHGLGVIDLAYFLGTTISARLMAQHEEELKQFYFEAVNDILRRIGKQDNGWTREVFEEQLKWALVDWARFMGGWGVWGNWRWVMTKAEKAIEEWEGRGIVP